LLENMPVRGISALAPNDISHAYRPATWEPATRQIRVDSLSAWKARRSAGILLNMRSQSAQRLLKECRAVEAAKRGEFYEEIARRFRGGTLTEQQVESLIRNEKGLVSEALDDVASMRRVIRHHFSNRFPRIPAEVRERWDAEPFNPDAPTIWPDR
jgi:hypothetical protein